MFQILCREQHDDEVEQEVTQRDQFNTDEVTLAATLVREPHQNSLDARINGGPVHTKLRIIEPKAKNDAYFGELFAGLRPHLLASGISLDEINLERPRILLIEDFGTTGLTGALADKKEKSPFNNFWRRVGLSSKSGTSGGRWGLGKLVFSSASSIHTFFGLTIRHTDAETVPYVMGQAVLTTREVDGKQYAPHVFFAKPGNGGLQLPIDDVASVAAFKEAFGITRDKEPGLSIAIPFALPQLTKQGLVAEVLQNYFFPILTGQLTVDVDGEIISEETFDDVAHRHGWGSNHGEIKHLVAFIREIHGSKNPDLVLALNWPNSMVDAVDEAALLALRTRLSVGSELIHVRAPIVLKRKSGVEAKTYFDLFLKKTPDESRGHSLYVRSAITVPDEARYFSPRQTFGALVASDEAVTSFLGDAENPAHTRWNGKADKLKDWKAADLRLREIRMSLARLQSALMQAVESKEEDALKDLFSIKMPGTIEKKQKTDKDQLPVPPPPIPPIPPIPSTPKLYRVDKINGGFAIRPTGALTQSQLPLDLRIEAAYDVLKGDPFKKFSPFDFDFNKKGIKVAVAGGQHAAHSPNRLQITLTDLQFKVDLTGFDVKRDLMVNVTRAK